MPTKNTQNEIAKISNMKIQLTTKMVIYLNLVNVLVMDLRENVNRKRRKNEKYIMLMTFIYHLLMYFHRIK